MQVTPGRNPWPALIVLCLGSFAILLDATIVNVAVPSMIDSIGASLNQALWVLNVYLLAFATLLITASRLGDVFGQRNVFVLGLAVFTASSAACGLAPDPNVLIVARVAQGVGAALLAPQALAIIMGTFPAGRRGAALGVFSGMTGLAAVSGPTVGGLIVTYLDWRWIFYVNVPIGVAAIALAFLLVPDVHTGRRQRFDVVGVMLASAGLLGVLYGLIEGQRYNWGEVARGVTIPEIIAAGVAVLAGFVVWERLRPEALLPLSMFRNRNFAVWSVLSGAPWFALSGFTLVFTINNQTVLGMSAIQAGLTVLPMTLVLAAVAPFSGRLTDRLGGKYLVVGGLLVYAGGMVATGSVNSVHATSFTFIWPLAVTGLGLGSIFAPLTTEALRETPSEMAGAASGVLNTTRQLGSVLGTAVVGAVLQNRLSATMHDRAVADSAQLPPAARGQFVDGFASAVSGGLQVGRGQSGGIQVPPGVPQPLAQQLQLLIHDVFVNGYVQAVLPTIVVASAAPALGALACLVLVRRARPTRTLPPATIPPLVTVTARDGARAHAVAEAVARRLDVRLLDGSEAAGQLEETLGAGLSGNGPGNAARLLAGLATAGDREAQLVAVQRLRAELLRLTARSGVVIAGPADGVVEALPQALHVSLDGPDGLNGSAAPATPYRHQLVLDPEAFSLPASVETIVAAARSRLTGDTEAMHPEPATPHAPRPAPAPVAAGQDLVALLAEALEQELRSRDPDAGRPPGR